LGGWERPFVPCGEEKPGVRKNIPKEGGKRELWWGGFKIPRKPRKITPRTLRKKGEYIGGKIGRNENPSRFPRTPTMKQRPGKKGGIPKI